jgi:PBP superfamily domain
MENSAGYFTPPTADNVGVALTQAQINTDPSSPDYGLENLTNLYTDSDPRAYPLSYYSYMIIPTGASDPTMTTSKRQTLADFIDYAVCQGQFEAAPIGYAPLPLNLVQAALQQVTLLHSADPAVDVTDLTLANCNNPTFLASDPSNAYLAAIAPLSFASCMGPGSRWFCQWDGTTPVASYGTTVRVPQRRPVSHSAGSLTRRPNWRSGRFRWSRSERRCGGG